MMFVDKVVIIGKRSELSECLVLLFCVVARCRCVCVYCYLVIVVDNAEIQCTSVIISV